MDPLILLGYISLMIYIYLGIYMYKENTEHFLYIFLLYFYQFTAIISTLYLEHGIYITEQARYSFPTGATARLVLYNIAFFIPLSYFLKKITKNNINKAIQTKQIKGSNIIVNIMLISISLCILFLYYNLIKTGIPLFSDVVTRYVFWDEFSNYVWAKKIHYQISLMGFVLGLIHAFANTKNSKVVTPLLLLLMIVYLVLFGEKFSSIFRTLYMYLIPFYSIKYARKKKYLEKKDFILIVLTFTLLFSLSIFHFSQTEDTSALGAILYRVLGLQGHTWWGADEYLTSINTYNYWLHFSDEFSRVFNMESSSLNTGMKYLMLLIGDSNIVDIYISSNVSFTMAYPAITLYTFGYVGALAFQVLFAMIFAVIIKLFSSSINNKQYIISVLSTKLYISAFTLFYQGDFFEFFNLQVVGIFYVLVLYSLIIKINRNQRVTFSYRYLS